jgi:tRNA threonylcarbamoyladenosine biosynthesis protein TsaE
VLLPVDKSTETPDETDALGAGFALLLAPGAVVWLEGELGAGKTVFARGCLAALGVTDVVTSPTFTIARRYEGESIPISHLDLYRLGDGLGGEDPGMFDPEFGPDRITLIEWPERGNGMLPEPDFRVSLDHVGGDTRRIRISSCR